MSTNTGLPGVKQGFTTRSEVPAIPPNMTHDLEFDHSTSLHSLLNDLQLQDSIEIERKRDLMKIGRRFEGLHVKVAFKHALKGVLCVIRGDHDSPERAARLAKESKREHWRGHKADLRGIIATISKQASNATFEIDVKYLVHA